jgi:hypothetical protein
VAHEAMEGGIGAPGGAEGKERRNFFYRQGGFLFGGGRRSRAFGGGEEVFWDASASVFQEMLTIDAIQEDILAPITAPHEMVDGSGELDPHLLGLTAVLPTKTRKWRKMNQPMG